MNRAGSEAGEERPEVRGRSITRRLKNRRTNQAKTLVALTASEAEALINRAGSEAGESDRVGRREQSWRVGNQKQQGRRRNASKGTHKLFGKQEETNK